MNLAKMYAQVINSINTTDAVESVVAYMRKKGHLSLLPQVKKILERDYGVSGAVLTVATQRDAEAYKERARDVGSTPDSIKPVIDSRVVGGYMLRNGQRFIDATFRRALVSLYQKTIKS